jgi:hypothetical protein
VAENLLFWNAIHFPLNAILTPCAARCFLFCFVIVTEMKLFVNSVINGLQAIYKNMVLYMIITFRLPFRVIFFLSLFFFCYYSFGFAHSFLYYLISLLLKFSNFLFLFLFNLTSMFRCSSFYQFITYSLFGLSLTVLIISLFFLIFMLIFFSSLPLL